MDSPKRMTREETLKKAQRLCAMQEKCTQDLQKKLKEWGCEPMYVLSIIEQLKKDSFLSDQRYARTFVREKFLFNKWGKLKIGYQLKLKSIPSEIIREAFKEINESDYYNLLYHELNKKHQALKKGDPLENRQKLFRFASSRGFENEIIGMAVDEIIAK